MRETPWKGNNLANEADNASCLWARAWLGAFANQTETSFASLTESAGKTPPTSHKLVLPQGQGAAVNWLLLLTQLLFFKCDGQHRTPRWS